MTSLFTASSERLRNVMRTKKRRISNSQLGSGTTNATAFSSKTSSSTYAGDHPDSLDGVVYRLRRNEMEELVLGWKDCDWLSNRRTADRLERALRHSAALKRVSIGWRTSRHHRDGLLRILHAISMHCRRLEHLQLVLDGYLPETLVTRLLASQRNLVTIDIRAVHVYSSFADLNIGKSNAAATSATCYGSNSNDVSLHLPAFSSQSAPRPATYDHCIVTRCLLQQYRQHAHLKALLLIDCDLTDDKVTCLADFLHIRGGIAELVLRSNRKLTGRGARMICQAPVMQKLDLSLCDLDSDDVHAVAEGLAARPWPVQQLLLAGNYRMGSMGLLALTQPRCSEKIVALDVSYCDNKDYRLVMVLDSLGSLPLGTTMREISMHGGMVASNVVAGALQRLLETGNSMRSIRLNDPHDPKPMNATQLRMVLTGLQDNYELEELEIDTVERDGEVSALWKEITFHLHLNQAGRRILRSSDKKPRVYCGFPVAPVADWCQVLENAGADDDLTVLYWIVRRGSDQFGPMQRSRKLRQQAQRKAYAS
jgi:hypothetical protein